MTLYDNNSTIYPDSTKDGRRYSDSASYSRGKRACGDRQVPILTQGTLYQVLDFRRSVKREFTVIMSFDWVRRGLCCTSLWVALRCTPLLLFSQAKISSCSALSVRQWIHSLTPVEIFKPACLEDIQVVTTDSVVSEMTPSFLRAGKFNFITVDHMKQVMNNAFGSAHGCQS